MFEANLKAKQAPDLTLGKPDEVFNSEGERVLEQVDTIDVVALDTEDVTPDKEEAKKET